jgi:hypothetical protein
MNDFLKAPMLARPVLSFEIAQSPYTNEFASEGAPPQLGLDVTPLLDGVPLMKGVFDAVDLLLHGVGNADTDLYTCSCGVAGCAGFHYEVALREGADFMAWEFPEEPYRTCLPGERFPAGQPLRLEFDKAQYAQALATLEQDLAALFAASEAAVVVVPGWSCDSLDVDSFAAMMAKARERLARWNASVAARREAEGALAEFAYVARLPNGCVLTCDLTAFAWERVHALELEEYDDRLEQLRRVIGPKLLADPLAALLALPAAERAEAFLGACLALPDDAWLAAEYSVLPLQEAHALAEAAQDAVQRAMELLDSAPGAGPSNGQE